MNTGSDLKELKLLIDKEIFEIFKLEYELAKLKYKRKKEGI